MNHIFVQRGNKGNANYSPLPSTSEHFLSPILQGIYFVKGALNNDRPSRESLHQFPARKLNIKCNANLAVDIPIETTSLSQGEMIKNVPMPERKIRTTTKKCCRRNPVPFM